MSSLHDASKIKSTTQENSTLPSQKKVWIATFLHLPKNVYLLLFFTLGKGFQLSIAALSLNYYLHSLGYRPDFIGLFTAMASIGSLITAVPIGLLADRIGRKPVLLATALLTPLCLALTGLMTAAPLLLVLSLCQGFVAAGYWVTNLPLLMESVTEEQRVGVLALNSFLLLGIGALGNLLGGGIPEFAGGLLHVSAASTIALRWGILTAASFTFVFGLPLWFLHETKQRSAPAQQKGVALQPADDATHRARWKDSPFLLFGMLLLPDLLFTTGEGAVVGLIQIYFVLRFNLLPGPLGIIFTISGLLGGIFSLTAPLFVRRWSKLRIVTTVQYVSAPLMILIGLAPTLPLAMTGEYIRSFMRTLIEPVYAAFALEQVEPRRRATLAGLYSVTWSMGYSIGPATAGWLQTQVSLSASFFFGAICLVLSSSLLLLFFGRKRG
jgi:MFS family permease